MVNKLIPLKLDENTEVYIQAIPQKTGGQKDASDKATELTLEKFKELCSQLSMTIKEAKESISDTITPDEMEIEFSFGISTELKMIFAGADASSAFTARFKWKKETE